MSVDTFSLIAVYPYGEEPNNMDMPYPRSFYRIGYSGNVEEVHDTTVGRFVLPIVSEMDKKVGARVHGQFEPRVSLPSRRLLLEVVDVFKEHSDEPIVAYVIYNVDHYEIMWGTEEELGLDDFVDTLERFVYMKLLSGNTLPFEFGIPEQQKTALYAVIAKLDRLVPHAKFYMNVGGRMDRLEFVPFNGDTSSIVWVK